MSALTAFLEIPAFAEAVASALPGEDLTAVEVQTGGASGAEVYRFTTASGAYLARRDGPSDGFRDPARQYICHATASAAGVAPALLHADPETRVSISRFVAAVPYGGPRAPRLMAMAEAVRRLHAAAPFPKVIPYLDAIALLLGGLAATGAAPDEVIDPARAFYDRIARAYPRADADMVASHNDLHPGNVLFDGERAWIIDWEAAFAADRFVDLASMLNFFAMDEQEEALIVETYLGRAPTGPERGRLFLMRQVNRLFYASLLLSMASRERPGLRLSTEDLTAPRFAEARGDMATIPTPEGRLRFGCVFLSEALHEMRSPAFEAALDAVATPAPW